MTTLEEATLAVVCLGFGFGYLFFFILYFLIYNAASRQLVSSMPFAFCLLVEEMGLDWGQAGLRVVLRDEKTLI
jgi:hypothetical protein